MVKGKKEEYGYVYYPDTSIEEYKHPEIRIFLINQYGNEPGKIHLGREIMSIKSQIDPDSPFPYAIKIEIEPFGYNVDRICKIIKNIRSNKHEFSRSSYIRDILKTLKKMKAIRYINLNWIQDVPKRSFGEWVPYYDRMVYKKENRLRELLYNRCDGSNGEFKEFLPKHLRKFSEEHNGSFEPRLEKNQVVWVYIEPLNMVS